MSKENDEKIAKERQERHESATPRPVKNAASREDIERAKKAAGL